MFVELIDQLRCPAPHDDSWLVLFAEESRDRHILRGTLGCPVCGARFAIEDGTVWFANADANAVGGLGTGGRGPADGPRSMAHTETPTPVPGPPTASPVPLPPTAVAAFLDLAEPGGTVALFGAWSACAEELGDIVERVAFVAIAPDLPVHPMQSAIMPPSRAQVPLADGSLRAAAVDAGDDAGVVVVEAARLVRSGGRIVAPASAPVPAGVHELTRDATWWIGERESGRVSGMIPLKGRRSKG